MGEHAHLHKSVLIQLFKLRMDLLNHSIRNVTGVKMILFVYVH